MVKKSVMHYKGKVLRVLRPWLLCTFFLQAFLSLTPAWATEEVPTQLSTGSLLMLPYFDAFVDTTGQLSVHEIQNVGVQTQFAPLEEISLRHEQGALWLRFTIAPRSPGPDANQTFLLDMGEDASLAPILFVAQKDDFSQEVAWEKYTPSQGAVFLMPQAQDVPVTAFIRMEGIPGMWFTPFLRTPHNAATSTELFATPAAIVALVVVMVLCLLRGLTEKGQWRYWAGLYTAVTLFYAIVGVPSGGKGYIPLAHMAQTMAPGVALILWAHVGRHLLQTPQKSRALDLQYMGLTLIGVIVALLPLIPGFVWTVHYLSLWPLLTLCFVPTTLGAWINGLTGAKRYLVACILPPLGVAIGLVGLFEPRFEQIFFLPVAVLPALPLWGLALGILMLTGTTRAHGLAHQDEALSAADLALETVESVVRSDPNLRLVPAGQAQSVEEEVNDEESTSSQKVSSDLEETLRWPVEQLLRDVAALEACSLPVAAKANVASIINTTKDIASIIDTPAKERTGITSMGGTQEHVFDLQSLLRQAHDTVSPVADKKNIALSWFMQPDLAPCYKGDALQLLFVLRLLLESSVRSTHRGAVHLIVRRVPESVNPGHLLFTVTDSGTGKPPHDRSITALARAWELSASYRGFLGVESNALGASISFTVHYEVCTSTHIREAEDSQDKPLPIILVSDNAEERHMWGFFLEKMPRVLEARTGEEAVALYKEHGAALLVLDARMPLPAVQQSMQALQQSSVEKNEPLPMCMAIYMDFEMADALKDMGFAHLLPIPITRHILCENVEHLLTQTQETAEESVFTSDTEFASQVTMPEEQSSDYAQNELLDAQEQQFFVAHEANTELELTTDGSVEIKDEYLNTMPQSEEQELASENMQHVFSDTENEGIESKESTVYPPQFEQNDEEEDIIDTGLPILDMGNTQSVTSMPELLMPPLPHTRFVQTIPEHVLTMEKPTEHEKERKYFLDINISSTEENAEPGEDFAQEPFGWDAQNNSEAIEAENIDATEERNLPKRPAPSEDKSNSAYLTSLLDDDEMVQTPQQESVAEDIADPVLEEQSPVQHLEKEAFYEQNETVDSSHLENMAEVSAPQLETVSEEIPSHSADDMEPWGEDVSATQNMSAQNGMVETAQDVVQDVAEPTHSSSMAEETVNAATTEESVQVGKIQLAGQDKKAKLVSKISVKKPKLVVSASSAKVRSESPVKAQSADETKDDATVKKVSPVVTAVKRIPKISVVSAGKKKEVVPETLEAVPQQEIAPTNGSVHESTFVDAQVPEAPSAPMASDAPLAAEISEPAENSVQSSTPEKLSMHEEQTVHAQSSWHRPSMATASASISSGILDNVSVSEEWVGEPMPIGTPLSAEEEDKAQVPETQNMADVSRTAAEKRGREELAHLREYLDKKNESILSSAHSPFEWVGEPSPIEPSTTQKHEAPIFGAPDASEEQNMGGPAFSQPSDPLEHAPVQEVVHEPLAESMEAEQQQEPSFVIEEVPAEPMHSAPAFSETTTTDAFATDTSGHMKNYAMDTEPLQVQKALSPIEQLLVDLDENILAAKRAFATESAQGVEESANAIASHAESFGLRTLGRLARTVQAAAHARDMEALGDLLPELDMSVQRNRAALET